MTTMIEHLADDLDEFFNNPIENPNFHLELRDTVNDHADDLPYLAHRAFRELREAHPEDGGDIYLAYFVLNHAERTALYIAIIQRFLTHLNDLEKGI